MEKMKIPALQRAMLILEYLEVNGKRLPSEIIADLDLPKSSTYNLLDEMHHHGLITQAGDGRYQLWMRLVSLGEASLAQLNIREIARGHLRKLVDHTGLLCHLGIMDGNAAYYILKLESSSTISVKSYEGKKLSLHRSGVGKCLLAWQPTEILESILPTLDYVPVTASSIVSPEKLRLELAQIAEQGWSFDDGEDVENVRCVAAPIFGPRQAVMGAISMVGTSQQITNKRLPGFVDDVKTCAATISKELGYMG